MLLLLMLAIALVGSALLNRNRRIQYTQEVSVLKEASKRHQLELKTFQQRSEFLQEFLRQRQVRKAEFETALVTFQELADRNSRIEPDESGRWFALVTPSTRAKEYACGFQNRQKCRWWLGLRISHSPSRPVQTN